MANPPPKIRWAIFFAVALLALAARLPLLGERPMHTDEAVNAYITGKLLSGESFHYDSKDRHGPALFILAEPIAKLLGARNFSELTEQKLRLSSVIAGTVTIFLFGAGVEIFGLVPCLIAALLFAFAPLPVYYSRYFIHETLFAAATPGLILSGWRALQKNSVWCAALAGFCAALMLACKETAVIHFFALGIAATTSRFLRSRSNSAPVASQYKMLLTAAMVFTCVTILSFTWCGQNWPALTDLFRAVPSFAARAGGQGHEKPFWYYIGLLCNGWSGGIILALMTLGVFRALHSMRRVFLVAYALPVAAIYSAIPYKTPWLALNLFLPFAIFAGIALEWVWFATRNFFARTTILAGVVALGFLVAHDTRQWVFKFPADEKNPYAYAHTGEDLLRLPGRIEQLSQQNNFSSPRIAVVAADPWPLPWYLRKYPQVGYWQPGQETGPADFFITTTDISGKLAEQLKNFRREYFGSRPNVVLELWSPAPAEKTP